MPRHPARRFLIRWLAITVATAGVLVCLAPPSRARTGTTQLKHREHRQVVALHRHEGTLNFFRHHRWLVRREPTRPVALRALHVAHVWIPILRRELRETRNALHPRHAVGHLAGWICIHKQEGAWNAQTGNGFYGGLQMTYGWAGRVRNAALLSPAQQIAAAEAEASEHGWSYSWMQGQWPNTFPPCAGLFA